MKAIALENAGPDYRLTLAEIPRPIPGRHEILIKVAAAGVNRADLHQAHGAYPPPPGAPETLGMEVSGHVAAVGEGSGPYKTGDAVCALLGGGGYAEYALAQTACVLALPPALDPIDAAALPEALFTAWTNIVDTGRHKSGETLIHGGSSVSGHRDPDSRSCATRFRHRRRVKMPRASNRRQARGELSKRDFVEVTKDMTGGKGVDVILDMVGGDYIQRNMAAAAIWGRIVNIAYQDGARTTLDLNPMLRKRLTLAATTLRARSVSEKGAIRDALAEKVWPLVAAGRIRPVVDRRFPLAQAQEAHRYMNSGSHSGKILLTPDS